MAKRKPAVKKADVTLVEEPWLPEELDGQLSVDVFQKGETIVVRSTIAGVRPEDLELFLNRDMLTIKGKRAMSDKIDDKDFLIRECYWGRFSRTIILPSDVKAEDAKATLRDGVLTIVLPKAQHARAIPVRWMN